jgi:hypothetical protein
MHEEYSRLQVRSSIFCANRVEQTAMAVTSLHPDPIVQ